MRPDAMIDFDSTGFPLLALPALALEVALWPVTRTQFDFYLGDRPQLSGEAIAEMESLAPRVSWRHRPEHLESLFVTAIQPEEARAFARWSGTGFRLPHDAEWRAIDATLTKLDAKNPALRTLESNRQLHPAGRAILQECARRSAISWRNVGLFENGLLEWVQRANGSFGLQGRPTAALFRVVHNPLVHEAIAPRTHERHAAFGFRLVRSLTLRVP